MTISVVITTYKRTPQLEKTLASISRQWSGEEVIVVDDECSERVRQLVLFHDAKYVPGRGNQEWENPSASINKGLTQAAGDIVILQNAECEHVSNVVQQFRERVREGLAVFAKVTSLNPDGSINNVFTAPVMAERPYFFCGAMLRKHFLELGGMDELFVGPCYDDDDFAVRMKKAGIKSEFADDILVNHQWHPSAGREFNMVNLQIFNRKHHGAWW